MGDVLINRTEQIPDGIVVYFTVPSINIDSQLQMTNNIYIEQISNGGFVQLGKFLLQELNQSISALLNK